VWNQYISSGEIDVDALSLARRFAADALDVLTIYGPEGDVSGPLDELEVLQGLLNKPPSV
jgi:hypothetical protein